jgi:hypothetical protein
MSLPTRFICLKCGPDMSKCVRTAKQCPEPKMYAANKSSYDSLARQWARLHLSGSNAYGTSDVDKRLVFEDKWMD